MARGYWRHVNTWSARSRMVAAYHQLGSLYDPACDVWEERAIRSQLRRMGVPIDPVLTTPPEVFDETYWEPAASDGYELRQRERRVANDTRPRRYRRR